MLIEVGLGLLVVIVMALGSWMLGELFGSKQVRFEQPALQLVTSTAMGLVILSCTLFGLCSLHLATFGFLLSLFLSFAGLAVWAVIGHLLPWWRRCERIRPDGVVEWGFVLFALVYVIWILLGVGLPPDATDELLYQLEVPKQMKRAAGFVFFRDNTSAYFPQFAQLFFLFGDVLVGPACAKLFHSLFGVLLAMALFGFSRQYLSMHWSLLAVVVFLSIPSVILLSSWAYVDLCFSLFVFLAICGLLAYFSEPMPGWGWRLGWLLGAAASVKYTGIQMFLLLLVSFLASMVWRKGFADPSFRGWWRIPVGMALGVGLFLLPYMLRNGWWTGWPLFPFDFGGLPLKTGVNWDTERAALYMKLLNSFGTVVGEATLWDILLAPVYVLTIAKFDQHAYYDGIVGPIFLLTPLLLWRVSKVPVVQVGASFCVLFVFYWAVTTRQVRFLLPLLPLACFLLVYGLSSTRWRGWLWVVGGLLVFQWIQGVGYRMERRPLRYWLGQESKDAYLTRLRSNYRVYQEANRRLSPSDKLFLLYTKNDGYYLRCQWRGDFIFEGHRLEKLLKRASHEEEILEFFQEMQITHLIMNTYFFFSPEHQVKGKEGALLRRFLERHTKILFRDKGYWLIQLRKKKK